MQVAICPHPTPCHVLFGCMKGQAERGGFASRRAFGRADLYLFPTEFGTTGRSELPNVIVVSQHADEFVNRGSRQKTSLKFLQYGRWNSQGPLRCSRSLGRKTAECIIAQTRSSIARARDGFWTMLSQEEMHMHGHRCCSPQPSDLHPGWNIMRIQYMSTVRIVLPNTHGTQLFTQFVNPTRLPNSCASKRQRCMHGSFT